MTLPRDRRELEEAARAKLHAMLEARLPQVRARLEEMVQSGSPRRAGEARRMLEQLHDEFGPPESP